MARSSVAARVHLLFVATLVASLLGAQTFGGGSGSLAAQPSAPSPTSELLPDGGLVVQAETLNEDGGLAIIYAVSSPEHPVNAEMIAEIIKVLHRR